MRRRIAASGTLVTIVAVLACARPGAAHDTWLVADENRVNNGDAVWLSFVTGEVFPLGEKATDPARVEEAVDHHAGRPHPLTGFAPQDKGLSRRGPIHGGGIHVIGVALKAHLIEMDRASFTDYLRHERADDALKKFAEEPRPSGRATIRTPKGQTSESTPAGDGRATPAEGGRALHERRDDDQEIVVESYTKFAKTIVEAAPSPEDDRSWTTPLGHRLEIVSLENPCKWSVGQSVTVRVLLDGHPWPGVPVSVGHEGGKPDEYIVKTKTNRKGEASWTPNRAGHGFVKAHVIRPASGLGKATWESFWASLTFRVIGKSDVSGELRSIRGLHGALTPGGVIGFRMGQAAMKQLGLSRGDDSLAARHFCPLEPSYASIADGIQTATGATLGRLALWIEEVADPSRMATVFRNVRTGESIRFEMRPDMAARLAHPQDAFETRSLALEAATAPDDALFTATYQQGDEHDRVAARN